ncbi:MAG: hypothetical protein ACLQQ4_05430 [Bacteroidia bacterium]
MLNCKISSVSPKSCSTTGFGIKWSRVEPVETYSFNTSTHEAKSSGQAHEAKSSGQANSV